MDSMSPRRLVVGTLIAVLTAFGLLFVLSGTANADEGAGEEVATEAPATEPAPAPVSEPVGEVAVEDVAEVGDVPTVDELPEVDSQEPSAEPVEEGDSGEEAAAAAPLADEAVEPDSPEPVAEAAADDDDEDDAPVVPTATSTIDDIEIVSRTENAGVWDITYEITLTSNEDCGPFRTGGDCILNLANEIGIAINPNSKDAWTCPTGWTAGKKFYHAPGCTRSSKLQDRYLKFQVNTKTSMATGTVSFIAQFFRDSSLFNLAQKQETTNLDVDVDVTKDVQGGRLHLAGSNVTYTITAKNNSGANLVGGAGNNDVQLEEIVPTGMSFGSWTLVPADWTCAGVFCSLDNAVAWADNTTVTFNVEMQLANGAAGDGDKTNTVILRCTNGCDGHSANETITGYQLTDTTLTITKTGPDSVSPGDNVTYTITVTNVGSQDAQPPIVVTDHVPAWLSNAMLSYVSSSDGSTWTCEQSNHTCTSNAMWAAGAWAMFQLSATVESNVPVGTVIINEAEVTWPNSIDPGIAVVDSHTTVVTESSTVASTSSSASALPFTGSAGSIQILFAGLFTVLMGLGLARFAKTRRV